MLVELETNVVAVERVMEYTLVPTEAPRVVPNNRPDKSWPQKGQVTFNEYSCRYRDGLPLVLNKITATVMAGEKVSDIAPCKNAMISVYMIPPNSFFTD
jgi:ABC-type multidrug transport system fused ATPase/permease subunit